jgi:hypothetical protein
MTTTCKPAGLGNTRILTDYAQKSSPLHYQGFLFPSTVRPRPRAARCLFILVFWNPSVSKSKRLHVLIIFRGFSLLIRRIFHGFLLNDESFPEVLNSNWCQSLMVGLEASISRCRSKPPPRKKAPKSRQRTRKLWRSRDQVIKLPQQEHMNYHFIYIYNVRERATKLTPKRMRDSERLQEEDD